jgi:hypothetical protein
MIPGDLIATGSRLTIMGNFSTFQTAGTTPDDFIGLGIGRRAILPATPGDGLIFFNQLPTVAVPVTDEIMAGMAISGTPLGSNVSAGGFIEHRTGSPIRTHRFEDTTDFLAGIWEYVAGVDDELVAYLIWFNAGNTTVDTGIGTFFDLMIKMELA